MSLFLPLLFIFFKQTSFKNMSHITNLLPIYNHMTGQVLGFSSGEILRHFLMFPHVNSFVKTCNLTKETCLKYDNLFTPASKLCSNSTYDIKDIFNTLHTLPNVTFVMLGASTVSLYKNYLSFSTKNYQHPLQQQPQQQEQEMFVINNTLLPDKNKNDKIDNVVLSSLSLSASQQKQQQYTKIYSITQYINLGLLIFYLLTVLYYVWQSVKIEHNLTEIILSYIQGLFIQYSVYYAATNK